MEGTSRNVSTADDLDSTVLRHQVQRYFSELQQDSLMTDTPLNMEFLGMKRKPAGTAASSSSAAQNKPLDSVLPKRIRFDNTGDLSSLTGDYSGIFAGRRQVHDSISTSRLDISAAQSERQMAEKQAKIIDLQQKVVQLEMQLSESESSKEQLKMTTKEVKEACAKKLKVYEDKIEDLKAELKQVQLKVDRLTSENHQKAELIQELKLAVSEEKLAFGRELADNEQLTVELQTTYEEQIRELRNTLHEAEKQIFKFETDAEEARSQLRDVQAQVLPPSCDHQSVIDQQSQVIEEMQNALFAQRTTFSQSQEAKLARIPQMEKEIVQLQQTNKLFRETAANELLLKEQINTLQESLQRYKEQCQTIPNLESQLKKTLQHLGEWEYLAQRLFDANSLPQVRTQVEEMRRKELRLVDQLGSLQVELNSITRTNSALREEVETLKTSQKTRSELEDRIRKLERKLTVVQKDRDHYRTVNEMYEREMTHVGAPAVASMEAQQVRELERLLDEYRSLEPTTDQEEKKRLTEQVAELNRKIESLQQQQQTAASSDGDTRVLHFNANPLDNARRRTLEQLAQLEKENESLRERVRLMESGQSQNLTLLVGQHFEQGCTPERLHELEEKLKSSELQHQRLEEVFRKYCTDFRRGVFELFGYQVDNDNNNFKLKSVYFENSSDYLSFKYVGDGLVVMDSPFLHTVDDLVQLHITNQKSIPVFLSALTIELFSRQSINSSAYPSMMSTQ